MPAAANALGSSLPAGSRFEGGPTGSRRRVSTMKKWLPTALLITGIVVAASFFVAIRMLLGSVLAQQTEALVLRPDVEVAAVQIVSAPNVVILPDPAPPASAAAAAPAAGVRFVSRVVEPTYTVASGDNLWSIAQRHGTTADALQAFNNLERPTLSIGQRLVIP